MNALILTLAAIAISTVGIGMLTLAGIADYILTRNEHRASQKGHAHGCPPH